MRQAVAVAVLIFAIPTGFAVDAQGQEWILFQVDDAQDASVELWVYPGATPGAAGILQVHLDEFSSLKSEFASANPQILVRTTGPDVGAEFPLFTDQPAISRVTWSYPGRSYVYVVAAGPDVTYDVFFDKGTFTELARGSRVFYLDETDLTDGGPAAHVDSVSAFHATTRRSVTLDIEQGFVGDVNTGAGVKNSQIEGPSGVSDCWCVLSPAEHGPGRYTISLTGASVEEVRRTFIVGADAPAPPS